MRKAQFIKLGILIFFCIVVLIWGINYLKGLDLFTNNKNYYSVYNHIDGLIESSPVEVNGYQVGQVKSIEFSPKNDGSLIVCYFLKKEFKIPKGSSAHIISSDIMGTKCIQLIINKSSEYYSGGDTIPGTIEAGLKEQMNSVLQPIQTKIKHLFSSMDSTMTVISSIFSDNTKQNLSESFTQIGQIVSNLHQTSEVLRKVMIKESENIQSILNNTEEITEGLTVSSVDIKNITKNISAVSDSLASAPIKQALTDLSEAAFGLNQIAQKINDSKGTAGELINNKDFYNRLNQLSSSLDSLTNDIRINPKKYIHFSVF
ncbi:MAG: MCE family protein [Prolixibacteraceae bacterium]|nr:MCE family protein [Prolixibacteraceae bacterium]